MLKVPAGVGGRVLDPAALVELAYGRKPLPAWPSIV
jgi:hypothetical protein